MLDVRRDGFAYHRQPLGLRAQHFRDDGLHRRAGKRRFTHHHFIRHRAQRIDVTARVDGALTHRLFGTHVAWRAEREPRLCHALATRALHRQRNAKVGDERRPIMQENVLGLDIAVDDVLAVRVVERARHFACNTYGISDGQLTFAFEACTQRFARDERHHVVQQAVRLAAVEQRENVRVLQPRGGADLGEKPFAAKRRTKVGVQHLDRDIALMLDVVREIHGGHAAGAEFARDAIAVGEGAGETVKWRGH